MLTAPSLRNVEPGMKVFDSNHHEIGKVDFVQFGDDDPDTPELEARGLSDLGERDDTFVDVIARAFRTDDLPDEVKERLMHQGFVRLDTAGLFAADRYITPEQIASISSDELMLNVSKDELIKRH